MPKELTSDRREPLPCPFCGGEPYIIEPQYQAADFQVGCDEKDNDCPVNPFVDGETYDVAVERWNHRAVPADPSTDRGSPA